ncbi:MAG: hypothetical protein J6Z49_05200, partial [Kiritimatiellae bacterium]|nr:hypothetical protein [Kiritimatiellia bacterium]
MKIRTLRDLPDVWKWPPRPKKTPAPRRRGGRVAPAQRKGKVTCTPSLFTSYFPLSISPFPLSIFPFHFSFFIFQFPLFPFSPFPLSFSPFQFPLSFFILHFSLFIFLLDHHRHAANLLVEGGAVGDAVDD